MFWLNGGQGMAWAFTEPAPATPIKPNRSPSTIVLRNRIYFTARWHGRLSAPPGK
jgi:hypothetical protein